MKAAWINAKRNADTAERISRLRQSMRMNES